MVPQHTVGLGRGTNQRSRLVGEQFTIQMNVRQRITIQKAIQQVVEEVLQTGNQQYTNITSKDTNTRKRARGTEQVKISQPTPSTVKNLKPRKQQTTKQIEEMSSTTQFPIVTKVVPRVEDASSREGRDNVE